MQPLPIPDSAAARAVAAPVPQRTELWVAAAGLALLLLWDQTSLDLTSARAFGAAAGFGWREHWLTAGLLHQGGRALAWCAALAVGVNIWHPLLPRQTRRERIWWLAMTVFCVVLIPLFKRVSATSCPWDLAEFGGIARYVSHWRFGIGDGGPGHCFPSGHASAAFAFFSGYFALRRAYPRAARAWLVGVIVAGTAFGWTQLARGAHYPSHTLWTAWLCWTSCALSARILTTPEALRATPSRGRARWTGKAGSTGST